MEEGAMAPTEEEVLQCQFHVWYPAFRHVALPCEFVALPEPFVAFLLEDGVFLPPDSDAVPRRTQGGEWEAHSEAYAEWDESEDVNEAPEVASFPELEAAMRAAIERLGGEVVPKLNWSSPKDVGWLSPYGNAKCRNPDEIMLLLKSSDTIVHDLCHAFDNCPNATMSRPPQFVLGLRRYYDLKPEMEFRCFVLRRQLIGISQREVTAHYEVLLDERELLREAIWDFFQSHIKNHFSGVNYTFDVYVTKKKRVKLIDFNPWGGSTLPLLFSWEELQQRGGSEGESVVGEDEESIASINHLNHSTSKNGRIDKCEGSGCFLEAASAGPCCREGERHVVGEEIIRVSTSEGGEGFGGDVVNNLGNLNMAERDEKVLGCEKIDFRIVETQAGIQLGMRTVGGVPLDLVDATPGSAIDEFLRRANQEAEASEE